MLDLPGYLVRIELARGGARTWSSLDTAHDWLMRLAKGIRFVVQIQGEAKAKAGKAAAGSSLRAAQVLGLGALASC